MGKYRKKKEKKIIILGVVGGEVGRVLKDGEPISKCILYPYAQRRIRRQRKKPIPSEFQS